MGFTEITFLFVFMPVSIIVYLVIDKLFHKCIVNNLVLVFFSILFYYWANKESLIIFLIIVVFTYMSGWMIEPKRIDRKGKRIAFPIICFGCVLVYYKYAMFIVSLLNNLDSKEFIVVENLIVPIGLSFVIFESISYVIDIYRGDTEPGSFIECITYLSLFPKLVSGPIVLWKDFHLQLNNRKTKLEDIKLGIDRIIIGYAKKVIFADTFLLQIESINSGIINGKVDIPSIWLKYLFYFFQIYFDFSGYSDIAIGLCSIFGFKLKENFHYPYLSKSITEFWRRWHISLGSWFREYVYIPLGGNRKGNVFFHILIVFLLTGIWHGSSNSFILWGGVMGLCVIFERIVRNRTWYNKIPKILKWFFTMIIIFLGWIMFSSETIDEVYNNCRQLFIPITDNAINFSWQYYLSNKVIILFTLIAVGHVFGIEKVNMKVHRLIENKIFIVVKNLLLLFLFVIDIIYVVNSTYKPFIYFQF